MKSDCCHGIIVKFNPPGQVIKLVLFHEIGHFALFHLGIPGLAHTCTVLNPVDDGTENARKEIEASEFLVEYLLDTEETMENLKSTGSFFDTDSIMDVIPELMAFKWRMLEYYRLVSDQCPIEARSGCMGRIGTGSELGGYRGDENGANGCSEYGNDDIIHLVVFCR